MTQAKKLFGRHILQALAIVASIFFTTACGDSTGPETSRIKIQLTDAPADEIAMAEVWISRIYLQGGEDDGAEAGSEEAASEEGEDEANGRVDLFNDPANPKYFDLLTLRDGVTADLTGFEDITSGMYQSLRFVVDSARVTLVEGLEFEDGTSTARLITPSAGQSGIKVNLNGVLDVAADESTTVLVDFDVDQSFVVQSSAQAVRRVLFTPNLREAKREKEVS
jgi:uncharacterized protein DUF4382